MKTLARYAVVSLAVSASAFAAPFLAIGDGAELFVTGAVGVRADDNIFLSNKATSDTIFDVTPGLEITFGKNADVKGAFTLADDITSYSSHSRLNTNLAGSDFNSSYDDGKLKLGFNAGYHELNQNTVDNTPNSLVGGFLVRRNVFSAGTNAEAEVSQITSVAAGFSYLKTDYKRTGYGDSDDYTIPLNFYYKWTPKVDLSAGYSYRNYQSQVAKDSTDNFFNIGARGEFTPLLTGKFAVGYLQRHISRGGSESLLGLDASLACAITPKTSLQLTASSAPDTSPTGLQEKNLTFGANLTSNISDQWSANAGLSYRGINYVGTTTTASRTDDYVEGVLGATYIINQYFHVSGTYNYRNNSSKLATSEFKQNVFSLVASVRY